jgi:hypothetical protein
MIVLKWIVIVLAVIYLGGVAVLYFRQREMLFPIPPVGRTAPGAAGLPEAEEHVLTTADGEKVIVWHVPAKPGRPVVLFFPGNGDFLAGRVPRFKGITVDGTGLVALSYRGYAGSSGSPSEEGLLQARPPLTPSPRRAIRRTTSSRGDSRSAPASPWRSPPNIRWAG